MARIGRDSVVSMVFLDTLVEKPEPSDHVTSLVGEERKRDPILLGEGSEDRDGVIADGEQRDAIRAESRPYILQLTSCVRQNGHQSALR